MNGADGTAETVSRQWVTAGFFDVLGVTPIAGRTFLADDDRQRSNVVVLSEAFWRTRFGADPAVIGREHPAGWVAVHGGRRRAEGVSAPGAQQHLGARAARPPSATADGVLPAGHRPLEAGRRARGGRRRHDRRRRRAGARVPADEQRSRRRARAAARRVDRQRPAPHVDAVSRRRRLRAAHLLRQRGQPAAGPRHRPHA